jgi:hypothetical protein
MNRTAFLIDGFNLYHSVIRLQRDMAIGSKWLDIKKLCEDHLYLIGTNAHVVEIKYFSALPII